MSGLPTPAAVPEELLLQGVFMEVRDLAAEAETEMTLDQTGAFIMADAKHGDLLMVLVNTRLLCALMVPPGQRPPLHLVAPGYAVATCLRTMFKAAMRLPEAAVDAAAVAAAGVVSPAELEAALRRAAAHLRGRARPAWRAGSGWPWATVPVTRFWRPRRSPGAMSLPLPSCIRRPTRWTNWPRACTWKGPVSRRRQCINPRRAAATGRGFRSTA